MEFDRRAFLVGGASLGFSYLLFWTLRRTVMGSPITAAGSNPGPVRIVEISDQGERQRIVMVPKVVKSDEEWLNLLGEEQFQVTRHSATEPPFHNAYFRNHESGLYRCVCCNNALFSSDTKFESGTGWPSFWAPVAEENIYVIRNSSLFMERQAVSCRLCDAHLGHVFDDGPKPTGLRYCMNSASLRFFPRKKA